MSRRLFSRLLSSWTGKPAAFSSTWPETTVRLATRPTGPVLCLYPAEKLDELHDLIESRTGSLRRPRGGTGSEGRQVGAPHLVDRAIDDLTNPRYRRKRARY